MNSSRRSRRSHQVWLATAAILLAGGVVLFVGGITPWAAPAAALLCLTLAVGQRTSWPFAFAASVIVQLAAVALIVRFTPNWNISLVGGSAAVFAVLGVAALSVFALVKEPRLIGARVLRVGMPIVALPVIIVVAILVRATAGADFEWAMRNDAVWNLRHNDEGDDRGRGARRDLSSECVASHPGSARHCGRGGAGRRRAGGSPRPRCRAFRDILGLVGALASAMLAALIGARSVHGGARWGRIVAAGVTGLVPLTWFAFGFAAQFGFYNATVALVLLLASWLAWLETRIAPVIGASAIFEPGDGRAPGDMGSARDRAVRVGDVRARVAVSRR